jgi:hypothetical protein
MPPYKRVNRLKSTQAAYLAGLVDADGSITLTKRHRNENRQLVLSVSNTDFDLLSEVRIIVGAGRIIKKRTHSQRHKRSGEYRIDNRQALELIRQLAPYLVTYKRLRAGLVLTDYVRLTPRNGHYTGDIVHKRIEFIEKFLALNPTHPKT